MSLEATSHESRPDLRLVAPVESSTRSRDPRSRNWVRLGHGLHVPSSCGADLADVCRAWAGVLNQDSGFTHLTAAGLRGWWLPPLPPGLPIFAAASTCRNRPRRPELRMMRTVPAPTVSLVEGCPIVSVEDALLACARHLGLLDVVVLVDSALHLGHTTRAALEKAVAHRRWGARRLRQALALADGRSESPYETLLRILHVVCEVDVEAQFELFHEGRLVARGDLRLRGTDTFHEYDGDAHRDPAQHRHDLRRERDIGSVGWLRRGYTNVEVLRRPVTVLRDADQALERPHDPDRILAWYDLLRESCFTAAGRHLLIQRLDID